MAATNEEKTRDKAFVEYILSLEEKVSQLERRADNGFRVL